MRPADWKTSWSRSVRRPIRRWRRTSTSREAYGRGPPPSSWPDGPRMRPSWPRRGPAPWRAIRRNGSIGKRWPSACWRCRPPSRTRPSRCYRIAIGAWGAVRPEPRGEIPQAVRDALAADQGERTAGAPHLVENSQVRFRHRELRDLLQRHPPAGALPLPQEAMVGVELHRKVGVPVLYRGQVRADVDLEPRLLLDLPAQAVLQGFPLLPLASGKLPEAAEHALLVATLDIEAVAVPDDADRHFLVGDFLLRLPGGPALRIARGLRPAVRRQRADPALGGPERTDPLTELHERLVVVARLSPRRRSLEDVAAFESGEHPFHVAVEDRHPLAVGDGRDRGRGVGSDAGNFPPGLGRLRQDRHLAGGLVKVAGPGIVAQAFPELEHRVKRRLRQRLRGGKALHPALVVRHDGRDLGLLEHDLGDPDRVRILRAPPWQVPRTPAVPRQELFHVHRAIVTRARGRGKRLGGPIWREASRPSGSLAARRAPRGYTDLRTGRSLPHP